MAFIRNAYNIDCLAPYGGPVEAAIAFGGMPKPESGLSAEYNLATGIVISFMVRNHMDKADLGPAMEWEQKQVDSLLLVREEDY